MNQSNGIDHDVAQDVWVLSYLKQSDDIHSYSKKETIAKKQSQSTCHREERQTNGMITKETAK